MAELVAATNWASGPLGPQEGWPQSLLTAVGICLSSRFPILLWWGPDLVMIYNDGYRPMLGCAKHPRALGAPGREVWPEIWPVIGPMLDQVMAGGGATWSDDQLLVLERNGHPEECYFTFSYSPVTDESGGVGGVFSVISETTERVLGERRLATLAEMAGLMGATSRTEVLRSATATLGTNRGDHPVAVVLDLVAGTGHADVAAALPAQLDPHGVAPTEELTALVGRAVDSGRATLLPAHEASGVRAWHAYPVADSATGGAQARASAVILFGESPTRRWDPALEAYATLCTTHVAAALADVRALAEERRRHEALVALDRAKSAFFTNISHELRTPLTLISGPVQQALAVEEDHAQRERLELVERNTARLARMVDAMLDFGRIEAGGLAPRLEDVDLSDLGRGLAESFRPAVERVGLAFEHDCGTGIRATADRDMVERIVLNLLSNAVKFTAEGRVRLDVREAGDDVEIAVSDTGVGLHADDVERAFERFERLPTVAGARSHEGAGIGLAMVRQLTELLGGTVTLSSEVGAGTTFRVRLPVRGPALPDARGRETSRMTPRRVEDFLREAASWDRTEGGAPSRGPQPGSTPAAAGAPRPRVLVAEDNADLGGYLADVLGADYDVDVVADGSAALARVRTRAPDLLLTDVMMPGLDGYGLVSAIRDEPALRDLPVVVLSARAGDEETSTALAAGADDYLVKPFSVVELRARVAGNLERAGARTRDAAWRRAVMEGFHDALVIMEPDGRVLEVNDRFSRLLGWEASDGPFTAPFPWDVHDSGTPSFGDLVAAVVAGDGTARVGETAVVAHDGRRVPVAVRIGLVDGAPAQPPRLLATVRDLTGEHEARERRSTAAAVTAELAAADELTDVVAAAVTGLALLYDGDVTVDVVVGDERHLFTTGGPVSPTDLDPAVAAGLEGQPRDGAPWSAADGIRLTADGAGLTCTAWVAFPATRPVAPDERVAGDLIVQALALACDRVVLSSGFAEREQHLKRAIESHEEIGQAVGILVERHRWTAAAAFEHLKQASQNHNTKLREVARRVIESGADPGA